MNRINIMCEGCVETIHFLLGTQESTRCAIKKWIIVDWLKCANVVFNRNHCVAPIQNAQSANSKKDAT